MSKKKVRVYYHYLVFYSHEDINKRCLEFDAPNLFESEELLREAADRVGDDANVLSVHVQRVSVEDIATVLEPDKPRIERLVHRVVEAAANERRKKRT